VRYDAFTYHYAFDYLKRNKPRLLYIAFDETDEYAHEGKYGQYLKAANVLDGFIENLWDWLQSDYRYKNKTTLIVTTDHGRGQDPIDYWRHHGSDVQGAEKVWLAVLGPDTPALGETENMETLYSSQIAKTISTLLGVEYTNKKAVGNVIERMIHD
jgi:bisphosphoglycerate-independent phosphoglycerate mutase (AlkP superfamily)